MKKIILTLVACVAMTVCVNAQAQKIGTINMRKAFDGFFKTKQADIALKNRVAEFDVEAKKYQEEYNKVADEYKALLEKAEDPSIADSEREQRKKQAEDMVVQIKKLEASMTQFERSARTALAEQKNRHRENILREITELVAKRAQSEGYAFIFDVGADSIDRSRIIVFTDGKNDITDEVLKQLNANAPADILKLMQEAPIDSSRDIISAE